MKKYFHVINIGLQNNLQYRFNYLTRTLFSFIPLFAMLSLWRTIYGGNAQAGAHNGYTEAQMIFYYMMVAIVDVFTAVNEDDWQIAADIREGNISQFLLKPVDYLWYRLCLFFFRAHRLCRDGRCAAGGFYLLFPAILPAAAGRADVRRVSGFACVHGLAAIFHLLRDGHARVLAAGDFHLHLHFVRV